eukprot:gene7187-9800_t
MLTNLLNTNTSTEFNSKENIVYLEVPLALLICIIYTSSGIAIHFYKIRYGETPWIHESSISCFFGLLIGGVLKHLFNKTIVFDGDLFFYLVLPPIIFSAGFSLKRKRFFQYIHLIALFGFFGTIINVILIALGAYYFNSFVGISSKHAVEVTWPKALVLAAVLSGTDEVSAMSLVRISDYPRLGALIFGEGVLNDALSIVLFKAILPIYNNEIQYKNDHHPIPDVSIINSFHSTISLVLTVILQIIASLAIGLFFGLSNARILKLYDKTKNFPIHQTALVMLCGYFAYCIAESIGVSGILTLFIAAVTLAHYSWYSLSKSAQIASRISIAAMSEIAEGFAFAYVGLSLWGFKLNDWKIIFAFYMLLIVICARIITILGLFSIFKLCFKSFDLPLSEQFSFILGGIVRGCLCWAQILQVQGSSFLITTVLVIIVVTLLSSGLILPVILPHLNNKPKIKSNKMNYEYERIEEKEDTNNHNYNNSNNNNFENRSFKDNNNNNNNNNLLMNLSHKNSYRTSANTHLNRTPSGFYAYSPSPTQNKFNLHHTNTNTNNQSFLSQSMDTISSFDSDTFHPPVSPATPFKLSSSTSLSTAFHEITGNNNNINNNTTLHKYDNFIIPHSHSKHQRSLAASPSSLLSMFFIQWVRFDEQIMKPYFGGSKTEPSRLLLLNESMHFSFYTVFEGGSAVKPNNNYLNSNNMFGNNNNNNNNYDNDIIMDEIAEFKGNDNLLTADEDDKGIIYQRSDEINPFSPSDIENNPNYFQHNNKYNYNNNRNNIINVFNENNINNNNNNVEDDYNKRRQRKSFSELDRNDSFDERLANLIDEYKFKDAYHDSKRYSKRFSRGSFSSPSQINHKSSQNIISNNKNNDMDGYAKPFNYNILDNSDNYNYNNNNSNKISKSVKFDKNSDLFNLTSPIYPIPNKNNKTELSRRPLPPLPTANNRETSTRSQTKHIDIYMVAAEG